MDALHYLASTDCVMNELIQSLENFEIPKINNHYFDALVRIIISQQLSNKSASSIICKLENKVGTVITEYSITEMTIEDLYSIGVSRAKSHCIHRVAQMMEHKELNFEKLNELSNLEIVEILTAIKGIGTWSAMMFLIFSCGRHDVFSPSDAGLKRAVGKFYKTNIDNSQHLDAFAEKWRIDQLLHWFYGVHLINYSDYLSVLSKLM